MKNILLESIGYVDAKYLDKAENYVPKRENSWVKWGAIAACLCLLIGGLLPLGDKLKGGKPASPGFVFSAYALDANNKVISSEMSVGESVPISFFESGKGIKGFFFSYPFAENAQGGIPSRIVLYDGPFEDCTPDELTGIIAAQSMDADKNYVFYVVSADTEMPCNFPYVCASSDSGTLYHMDLTIDKAGDGYTATLNEMTEIQPVANIMGSMIPTFEDTLKWIDFLESGEIPEGETQEISISEYPDVTFRWQPEKLEIITEINTFPRYSGDPIWDVYFCDLNGDGMREICSTTGFEPESTDKGIIVVDLANGATHNMSDPGLYDYSLVYKDGQLWVEKRASMQCDVDILESGQLVLETVTGDDGKVFPMLTFE